MKLKLWKPLSVLLKITIIFSMINLVFPFDLMEGDSNGTKHKLSISSALTDFDANDVMTLALHANGQHRTRRLKRDLSAILDAETVLSNKQISSFSIPVKANEILTKNELILKHHRGPPKA